MLPQFVITNGSTVVASRYISDKSEEPLSLYYSEGSQYVCEDGVCRMEKAKPDEHSVLIVSEKLTDFRQDWKKVPGNHVIAIHEDMSVSWGKI